MENKEMYEMLVLDVITFDNEDIITVSNGLPGEDPAQA